MDDLWFWYKSRCLSGKHHLFFSHSSIWDPYFNHTFQTERMTPFRLICQFFCFFFYNSSSFLQTLLLWATWGHIFPHNYLLLSKTESIDPYERTRGSWFCKVHVGWVLLLKCSASTLTNPIRAVRPNATMAFQKTASITYWYWTMEDDMMVFDTRCLQAYFTQNTELCP